MCISFSIHELRTQSRSAAFLIFLNIIYIYVCSVFIKLIVVWYFFSFQSHHLPNVFAIATSSYNYQFNSCISSCIRLYHLLLDACILVNNSHHQFASNNEPIVFLHFLSN